MGQAARDCGSTCVFCISWPDKETPGSFTTILANLGDSRGVILRKTNKDGPYKCQVALETADHSPDVPEEERRIKAAGGVVERFPGSRFAVPRVDGILGCSRALGDFRFKEDAALLPENQKVSIVPDVYEYPFKAGDLIVLGCDGIFDVLSTTQVADIISKAINERSNVQDAASAVVKEALADPKQQDNVTCVVAWLMGE